MMETMRQVKSYRDEGEMRAETDPPMPGADGQTFQNAFVFERPNRFRIKSMMQEVICDGKELTIYLPQTQRYKVMPARAEIEKQLATYAGPSNMWYSVGQLFIAQRPEQLFAEYFRRLDVTGRETVEGERCAVLKGTAELSAMGFTANDLPVTIWMRESDGIVRRVELDMTEALKKQIGEAPFEINSYHLIYDVKGLRVDEKLEPVTFRFDPPEGAKQVEELHTTFMHMSEGAERFALSGKPAPTFALDGIDGRPIDSAKLRGRVLVLGLVANFGRSQPPGLAELQQVHEHFAGKEVVVLAIMSARTNVEELRSQCQEQHWSLPVAVDEDAEVFSAFEASSWSPSTILIGKDGVVQGRFGGFLSKQTTAAAIAETEKLLAGEQLASARPLSADELREVEHQTDPSVYVETSSKGEPLHEDWLVERWSVRANASGFGFGSGALGAEKGLWVRDGNTMREYSPEGKLVAEIALGDLESTQFGQTVTVARFGRGRGALISTPIPADEEQQQGYRPPKGATLTAVDESGAQLWSLQVEGAMNQFPQHVCVGDLDGRGGDEVMFVQEQVLYVVDERGQIVVRKPAHQWVLWMITADRDRDGRAEIYLRTPAKLLRYDYRPAR
jgi:peroxiredoxin/outer membrane lipoprotein-sorting protein